MARNRGHGSLAFLLKECQLAGWLKKQVSVHPHWQCLPLHMNDFAFFFFFFLQSYSLLLGHPSVKEKYCYLPLSKKAVESVIN